MINKKEFDLLLQEISQIEAKIVEVKILNQFDEAIKYESALETIKEKAKNIILDKENASKGFDKISLQIFSSLIQLDSEIDYYILKIEDIIESASENKIDAEALEKIKILWNELETHVDNWNKSNHNPIEEVENEKYIAKISLQIILCRLQAEGVIDFSKIFKYCKKEFLVNAIKEVLVDGAKDEFRDELRKHRLIELTKNLSKKDLYDYRVWQQVLMIKNITSRDDHIEILSKEKEFENQIEETEFIKQVNSSVDYTLNNEQELDIYYEDSIISMIKRWIFNLNESANQKKMNFAWLSNKGPAFKCEFIDGNIKYSKDSLDKNTIELVKKLTIASNGVGRYSFEKDSKWKTLEELEFLEKNNSSNINLSPDKTYNCIGNDCFCNCKKLRSISFGNIEIIGERAFKNCTNISNVIFPKSIMNIGEDAFCGCTNLTKVEFLGNPKLYILERPQNIINCFKDTKLQELVFSNIESAFDFAITDCPHLKNISISTIPGLLIPFKICKYRFGRKEGIVSFVGEKSLSLWKKRNRAIRFFELTDEDKKKYINT